MFRPMYSKQVFDIWSLFGFISVFSMAALLKLEITVSLFFAFIASSFRVTEENLVFQTVQSGPYSFLNVFSALKGTHFYILFGSNILNTFSCQLQRYWLLKNSCSKLYYI